MRLIRRMRAGLDALKRDERGFAVPAVITVIVIGLGFSAAAITVTLAAQSGTTRDAQRKDALGIADAGAQRALLTYNKITTTTDEPCVLKISGPQLVRGNSISPATRPFCGPIGGASDPDARVGDGYFTYWVNPCVGALQGNVCNWGAQRRRIRIVSEGFQGGITRRVAIDAWGVPGSTQTGTAKAIGLEAFTMSGWSELEVPAATNGDFVLERQGGCPGAGADADGIADGDPLDPRNGCPRICVGDWYYDMAISVGPGHDVITPSGTQPCNTGRPPNWPRINPPGPPESQVCSNTLNSGCREPTQRTVTLAPIESEDLPTTTDNSRLGSCTTIWTNRAAYDAWLALPPPRPPGPPPVYVNQPGCTMNLPGKETTTGPGTVSWNAGTRTLTLNGTGDAGHRFSVDLGGRNYVLCRLELIGHSRLNFVNTTPMPQTTSVASKVFFDAPENCPGLPGDGTQIQIEDGSNIESQTWSPFNAQNIGLLPLIAMVGSEDRETRALVHTYIWYFAIEAMMYAPRTDIILDTWARENEGWFAGKTLTMSSGAEIESPPELDPIGVGIASPDFILFQKNRYVECGPRGASIDANC